MAEAFTGLTTFHHVIDDIIIYDSDEHQHASHVRQFLQHCADKHILYKMKYWREYYLVKCIEKHFGGINIGD